MNEFITRISELEAERAALRATIISALNFLGDYDHNATYRTPMENITDRVPAAVARLREGLGVKAAQ